MALRLGILTPVLSARANYPDWMIHGSIDDAAVVVEAAERLGYDFCTCSEHIALPLAEVTKRHLTYWDPLASFSYLAAATSTIRFVTWLVVLGYHHPLDLAKRYGQLDRMSDSRLVLGVGVGSLKEEFDLLGAQFEGRGDLADDAIRAIRAVWGRNTATYHGTHYDFSDFWVQPCAPRTEIPIWVGGRTRRSLRRAIELGDGWAPFALTPAEINTTLKWGRSLPAWETRSNRPFEVLYRSEPLDPIADPDGARRELQAAQDCGATMLAATIQADSRAQYLDQLASLRSLST
jgi:probable F420-dependent oxidoreductase